SKFILWRGFAAGYERGDHDQSQGRGGARKNNIRQQFHLDEWWSGLHKQNGANPRRYTSI
ncbi:MAG: hypothetical protein RLZZ369_2418, partial [Pseudomonadota bacterium]